MSVTALCRSALNLLGDYPLNDLQEDTKQARLCREEYANARDATLRAAPWRSPRTRDYLPSASEPPPFGWGYAYKLPVDCAFLITPTSGGGPNAEPIAYEEENGLILTDAGAPLPVVYVTITEDTTKFDAILQRAIEAHLALRIAFPLTGVQGKFQEMTALYQFYVNEATRVDSKGGTPKKPKATSWETARY